MADVYFGMKNRACVQEGIHNYFLKSAVLIVGSVGHIISGDVVDARQSDIN